MTTVACVGVTVRDLILTVDRLPDGSGKVHANARMEAGGGVAASAAAAIAALGGDARLISAVGDDRLGSELRAELQLFGVDTSGVRVVPGVASPLSAVTVASDGERAIVNHTDPGLFAAAAAVAPEELVGVNGVLTDIRWPEGARRALSWAAENRVPGVVDYDAGGQEAAEALIDLASHVVFASDALRRLTRMKDPEDGLRRLAGRSPAWLGVTDGRAGTFWLDGDEMRHWPAFEVDVVDTTGAGDAYHGAFALALARGDAPIEAVVRYSSAVAALVCTRLGGREGLPTAEEVAELMRDGR